MDDSVISQSDGEFDDLESCRSDSESEIWTSSAASFSSGHLAASDLASGSDGLPPPPIMSPVVRGRHVIFPVENQDRDKPEAETPRLTEAEQMKKRFARLLLGEDMSGGGRGISSALAISNAVTNLGASVFGELWKLEPLSPQKKSMWQQEMKWLLCVSDSIVELIPSQQESLSGESFEIMVTQQRSDLYTSLPALKKLDGKLMSLLEGFKDTEFHYVDRGIVVGCGDEDDAYNPCSPLMTLEEKWWLPFPKVPSNGLCEDTIERLQQCRECTQQIFKAAVAINSV